MDSPCPRRRQSLCMPADAAAKPLHSRPPVVHSKGGSPDPSLEIQWLRTDSRRFEAGVHSKWVCCHAAKVLLSPAIGELGQWSAGRWWLPPLLQDIKGWAAFY